MQAKLETRPSVRRCAVTGALGLALLGAGLPAAASGATTATTRDTGSGLSRFYDQRVEWTACEGTEMPKDLQCGKVTVPLDYSRPRGGTLDVALARYRATGDSRGSVLLNFGGPGGSGINELALGGKEFMHLTNGYDVVTFDPRGVGRSSPVSCGPATLKIMEATDGDGGMTDPEGVLERLRDAAAECAKYSGPVLPHIGTVDAARDMDVMRRALGDDRLNYLGFSYGTRLGAVYAARFPDKVGRMVLDGVDTLTEPLAEQGLAGARGQQTALENFLDWCVEDVACPFGQDARDARDQVERLVASSTPTRCRRRSASPSPGRTWSARSARPCTAGSCGPRWSGHSRSCSRTVTPAAWRASRRAASRSRSGPRSMRRSGATGRPASRTRRTSPWTTFRPP